MCQDDTLSSRATRPGPVSLSLCWFFTGGTPPLHSSPHINLPCRLFLKSSLTYLSLAGRNVCSPDFLITLFFISSSTYFYSFTKLKASEVRIFVRVFFLFLKPLGQCLGHGTSLVEKRSKLGTLIQKLLGQ